MAGINYDDLLPAKTGAAPPRSGGIDYSDLIPKVEPPGPSSSPGYTAGVLLGLNPPVSDADKVAANVRTGVKRIPGAFVGIPHGLSALADVVMGNTEPSAATKFLPSEQKITGALQELDSRWNPSWMGAPSQPYQPETTTGRVLQDVISGAPSALVGGGGLWGAAARQFANAGGATGGNLAQDAEWTPQGQVAASLLGALAGGYGPRGGQALKNNAKRALGDTTIAEKTANARIVNAADMEKAPMLTALDNYNNPPAPAPAPAPIPGTGTLRFTGNPNDPAAVQAWLNQVAANAPPAAPPPTPNLTTREVLNDPGLNYYDPMAGVKPTANGAAGLGNFVRSTGLLGAGGYALGQGAKAFGLGLSPGMATALGFGGGLLNFGKNRYQDFQRQVGGIGRRMLDDPVIAARILGDYNGTDAQVAMPHQWRQYPGLLPALSTDNLYE